MIKIDGSQGEGGGQILRSSLALSLCTGQAFRIENIRARRKKPGLLHQHLTAVLAARAVGEAEVSGAELAAVYVPTTPNPTSGYLEIVPMEKITPTDWTVDQAMSFIISGGAVAPEFIPFSPPAHAPKP